MPFWVYYNDNGLRVRQQDASFAAQEVSVVAGVPAAPRSGSMTTLEYHDVHHVLQPDIRKDFASVAEMKAWLAERSAVVRRNSALRLKAKGKAR